MRFYYKNVKEIRPILIGYPQRYNKQIRNMKYMLSVLWFVIFFFNVQS